MTLGEIGSAEIEQAMAEARELGRVGFLQKYGFSHATTYLVLHGGEFYDPKALIGAAHGFVPNREPLAANEFDATVAVAALRKQDFKVVEFNGLWWVNQSDTYDAEHAGGYVWAPQTDKAGKPQYHHVNVSKLRPGQRIIHCARGRVRAVGMVIAQPETSTKPAELGDAWGQDGYLCRVHYEEIKPPLEPDEIPNRVPDAGPFTVNGTLKQAYLTRIADSYVFPLLELLLKRVPTMFDISADQSAPQVQAEAKPSALTSELLDLLSVSKNVVLEGVPGTGKSFAIQEVAASWRGRFGRELVSFAGRPYTAIVLHPSTSYEDFIEGLRPVGADGDRLLFDEPVDGRSEFKVDDGYFLRACAVAVKYPHKDVLVLLDELNRCNISSVLGDLLLTLEGSRRAVFKGTDPNNANAGDWHTAVPVTLPYSGRIFFVPDNVYVVATTNTTDRSVAPIDAAIRRRFSFFRLEPDFAQIDTDEFEPNARELLEETIARLRSLNESVLGACLGPDAMLGQSYVHMLKDRLIKKPRIETVRDVWRFSILPQLIDGLRSYGAEDLLSAQTRDGWFTDHGAEIESMGHPKSVLAEFDAYLGRLDLEIVVAGTGLARGARTRRVPSSSAPSIDFHQPPVETEYAEGDGGTQELIS